MNWLDIVIVVTVSVATFYGLRIGLIKAVLSLAGAILGVILAGQFYALLAEQLTFITQPNIAEIVAFAAILIGVMVAAAVLAALLKWLVSLVMLGWVNRLGGATFGFSLGALFCGALLAIWVKYFGVVGVINESTLAPILLDNFPVVLAFLPAEFDAVRAFFQ